MIKLTTRNKMTNRKKNEWGISREQREERELNCFHWYKDVLLMFKSRCNQVVLLEEEEVTFWSLLSSRLTYTITCCAVSPQTQHIQTWAGFLAPKVSSVFSISEDNSITHLPGIQTRSLGVSSMALFSYPHITRFLSDKSVQALA